MKAQEAMAIRITDRLNFRADTALIRVSNDTVERREGAVTQNEGT